LHLSEILIGLPGYQITGMEKIRKGIRIGLRYTEPSCCPHCGAAERRSKGWCRRTVRHEDFGTRAVFLDIEVRKWLCKSCERQYRERLPGILPSQRASEAFQQAIYELHLDGINRSRLGRRKGIGAATVERYFRHWLERQFAEWHPPRCPLVLGIDQHFFTRRKGFATTFCDLKNRKIYDVVLGRTELSLDSYLQRLEGKSQVRVVCMDLASVYRSIVRKHFPNAVIVADRFHVIRLINHHFLACWRELDPVGSKHRGLLSLMRRHRHNLTGEQQAKLFTYLAQFPALEPIYRFKQKLCHLLLNKRRTRRQCEPLAARFLRAIQELRDSGFAHLTTLGETLYSWRNEIAAMWRFTRNNGITEGFHTKMEMISRQAFGFRNFENYRKRVKVLCG
jgi:transposase